MGDVSGGEGQMIIAMTWWAFSPSQRVARLGKEFFQIFWCVVSPLARVCRGRTTVEFSMGLKRGVDWTPASDELGTLLHLARALVRQPNQCVQSHIPKKSSEAKEEQGVGMSRPELIRFNQSALCFTMPNSLVSHKVDAIVRRSVSLEASQMQA